MSDDEQPKNRGGRPRVPVPGLRVSTFIPCDTFDQMVRLATRRDQTVSAYLRDLVVIQVTPKKP